MKQFRNLITILILLITVNAAQACTEVALSQQGNHIVARSFDWPDSRVFLVINPIGYARKAVELPKHLKPLHWHAKYRSLSFELANKQGKLAPYAVAGGMNSQGLVASVLWLNATQYPKPAANKPSLDSASLAQYVIDRYATVEEAIKGLKAINVVPVKYHGVKAKLHLALFDKAGHIAFIEYLHGKMKVIEGQGVNYQVITNTAFPTINGIYHTHSGLLPTGYSSIARYLRAADWIKYQPIFFTNRELIDYAFNLLTAVKEPASSPDPTQWYAVYDLKRGTVYFAKPCNPKQRAVALSAFPCKTHSLITIKL